MSYHRKISQPTTPQDEMKWGMRRYSQTMLEELDDLRIRGFDTAIDATPTTGVTSLPTPRDPPSLLTAGEQELYGEEQVSIPFPPVSIVSPHERERGLELDIPRPGAPLVKDLDSFTEGTVQGSFEALPPLPITTSSSPPSLPSLPRPLSASALSMLPKTVDQFEVIESWREEVSIHTPRVRSQSLAKRSRSSDGEVSDGGQGHDRARKRTDILDKTRSLLLEGPFALPPVLTLASVASNVHIARSVSLPGSSRKMKGSSQPGD